MNKKRAAAKMLCLGSLLTSGVPLSAADAAAGTAEPHSLFALCAALLVPVAFFAGLLLRRRIESVRTKKLTSRLESLDRLIECAEIDKAVLSSIVNEPDFDRVLDIIANTLKRQLLCDRVLLTRCNEHGLLRFDREWRADNALPVNPDNLPQHYKLWDQHIELMRSGQILAISDLARHEITRSLIGDFQSRTISVIIAPIFVQQKLWGAVFVTFSTHYRCFTEVEKNIMRGCTGMIAVAELRKRRNEAFDTTHHVLKSLLDNLPVGIVVKDAGYDFRYILCNQAFCRFTGRTERDLIGKNDREAGLFPGTEDAVCALDERVIKQGAMFHSTERLNITGSAQRIYERFKVPLLLADGRKLLLVSYQDVTELNLLLADEKDINRSVIGILRNDSTADTVQSVLESVCTRLNAARAYVMSVDGDLLTPVYEYRARRQQTSTFDLAPRRCPQSAPWFREIASGRVVRMPDVRSPEAAGRFGLRDELPRLCEIQSLHLAPVMSRGKLLAILGVTYEQHQHDLSEDELLFLQSGAHLLDLAYERNLAKQQILDALNKARAADKAKSFFIASVSHEIRTPLNAVIGFAELLRDGGVPEEQRREYLNSIAYSGSALLQLINDVLDLSKLEADQMEIVPQPTDFRTLGEDVMKVFAFRARERGNRLSNRFDGLPPTLEIDRLRIRQILFNLIGNAVKFTRDGSVTLNAGFTPKNETTGTLEFSVTDTGIGISQEDMKRLMEPFVQLSRIRGSNATANGTGLGLSISKRLANRMNGNLWVKSAPGQGSTFGVTLPDVRFARTPVEEPAHNGAAASVAPQAAPKHDLSVLIVDDVPMNLKVLSAVCRKLGVREIVEVQSGRDALARLAERRFDLVLTDMWMPEMSGAELARRIRIDPALADTRVVAVTADIEAKDNFDLTAFSGVLLKPVTPDKLRKLFESC